MATRRYLTIGQDPDVWVEGSRGHWWVICPACAGPILHFRGKPYAIRAARSHHQWHQANQASSSAEGGGR